MIKYSLYPEYFWPALVLLAGRTTWITVNFVTRMNHREDTRRTSIAGCLVHWGIVAILVWLAFRAAGLPGAVLVLIGLFTLPLALAFIVALGMGRLDVR